MFTMKKNSYFFVTIFLIIEKDKIKIILEKKYFFFII